MIGAVVSRGGTLALLGAVAIAIARSVGGPAEVGRVRGTVRSPNAYDAAMTFTRIKIDHQIMGGLPCIAGTRIPAAMIVRMVAAGTPNETILEDYPQLSEDDIREALRFAAANIDQRVIPLVETA